jgi:hypothetical protein
MRGICRKCRGRVKSGGDIHPEGGCNIVGRHGDRGQSLLPRRRSATSAEPLLYNKRGAAVAGTGKPAASSKEKA